jgi:hypothetical protein
VELTIILETTTLPESSSLKAAEDKPFTQTKSELELDKWTMSNRVLIGAERIVTVKDKKT